MNRHAGKKPSDLLDDPSKWTKGVFARNAEGMQEFATNDDAVCFCMLGALRACYIQGDALNEAWERLEVAVPGLNVARWQDKPERTFEEVRAKLLEVGL